jgi:dTDP-4-dehydrorhamnose reductase
MTSLVVGASGLIGYEFYRQNRGKKDWFYTYRNNKLDDFIQLDATDAAQTDAVVGKIRPDVLVLPAAMANVNLCEKEKETAYRNNVGIVRNCIAALKKTGKGKIVFFSTDYLFDGKDGPYAEDARPNPINYYGKLKLMCEQELASSGLGYLILRTTGVFGWEKQRKNFLYRVLDTLGAKKELVIPNDQFATPTYVRDLVAAAMRLLELGKSGIYNIVGPEFVARDALAKRFAAFFGLETSLILAKPTSSFNDLAPRPLKAGFKAGKIAELGIRMRGIDEALRDMQARKAEDDAYA